MVRFKAPRPDSLLTHLIGPIVRFRGPCRQDINAFRVSVKTSKMAEVAKCRADT